MYYKNFCDKSKTLIEPQCPIRVLIDYWSLQVVSRQQTTHNKQPTIYNSQQTTYNTLTQSPTLQDTPRKAPLRKAHTLP